MLLPATPAIGIVLLWAAKGGGLQSTTWYPTGLLLIGLTAVAFVITPTLLLNRSTKLAIAFFAAYVGWSYLSITWAAAPGLALEGSNRTLIYFSIFTLFALMPWSERSARLLLGVFIAGITISAIATTVQLTVAAHPDRLVPAGRLVGPTGYHNASAALWTMTALPALFGASRWHVPAIVRGLLAASGVLLFQLAVLTESRGWLFSLPVILVVALVICPGRARFAIWLLAPAGAVLLTLRPLLNVYRLSNHLVVGGTAPLTPLRNAMHGATVACAVTFVCVLLAGTLLARLDRRYVVPPFSRQAMQRAGIVSTTIAVGVAGLAIVLVGFPSQQLTRAVAAFGGCSPTGTEGVGSRYTALGSSRSDIWRVSTDLVVNHPLLGLGQDNFAEAYLQNRGRCEEAQWTTSLPLRLLVHTGAVGFALFAGFVVAALMSAFGSRSAPSGRLGLPGQRELVVVALLPLVVWVVHGSLDWFWEMPALSGAALAMLGTATALGRPGGLNPTERAERTERTEPTVSSGPNVRAPSRPRQSTWRIVAAVCVVAAAGALVSPYLASRDITSALNSWKIDPKEALASLDRAQRLNPLDPRADVDAGIISLELARPGAAAGYFRAALRRDPGDWFSDLGLGMAAAAANDPAGARLAYQMALNLNPRDPTAIQAAGSLATATPLSTIHPSDELRMLLASRLTP